jgi:hypothetical protein
MITLDYPGRLAARTDGNKPRRDGNTAWMIPAFGAHYQGGEERELQSGSVSSNRHSNIAEIRRRSSRGPAAFEGRNDVRFGSLADMCGAKGHVRFTPESRH